MARHPRPRRSGNVNHCLLSPLPSRRTNRIDHHRSIGRQKFKKTTTQQQQHQHQKKEKLQSEEEMGGGKRRSKPGNSNGDNSGGGKPRNRDNRRRGGSSSPVNITSGLFVEGGLLSDWQLGTSSPALPRGRKRNPKLNVLNSGSSKRSQGSGSGSRSILIKSNGNAFGYTYPALDVQGVGNPESSAKVDNGEAGMDKSEPIILFSSKETQIVAYVDEKPSIDIPNSNITYDYNSDFVLGEVSHRGLGFGGEYEAMPIGVVGSSMQMEDQEEESNGEPSSPENEIDEMTEELMFEKSSVKKNSGFLSIGGMKLYTKDVSDEDSDESQGELSAESESGESDDLSESDCSEDLSESSSNIDEDVVEDYLEGIGGRDALMDAKWLVDKGIEDESESVDSSSSSLEGTLEKLGGITLQDASRDYGMKKPTHSKPKIHRSGRDSWTPAVDNNLMLYKDIRSASGKKNGGVRFPQSWPLEAQKSKRSRSFPGEKKKHRKELIAAKRRDRMLSRGVDLEQINMKLEQIVLDGIDMYSFQPMHSRDCSQVRRLAAIYQLQSGCQGSGKKRFVTVTQTQRTSMPSSSDKLRLEK
ncbi:hypothetical protein CRG98_027230, partial [Punica granatum]